MPDASTFNLNPTFPMGAAIDAFANKTYKEQQMRNQQQELLMKGLDQFSGGVNNLVNRKIAIAQALAQAKLYSPMMGQMTGQTQPTATAAPAQALPSSVPNSVSGPDFLQGLKNGSIPVGNDGSAPSSPSGPIPGAVGGIDTNRHAASMPPVPSPLPSSNPVDQQTLATALYTGAPQNPAEMIANMLKSQGLTQEKAYQTGQLGVAQGGLDVQKQQLALDTKYKMGMLSADEAYKNLDLAIKNRQIDTETAGNIRTNIATLQSRLDSLNEQTKGVFHPGVAANAVAMMNQIESQIQSLSSQLPTTAASHPAVGGTIPGLPGTIKSIKVRN